MGRKHRGRLERSRRAARLAAALLLATSVLSHAPVGVSAATTINVPADHATIQAAIDAAVNGDTVLVAPGTYVEQIRFHGKAITVESSGGPDVTTIDAGGAVGANDGSAVRFWDGEGRDSVLRGFTITGGDRPVGAGINVQGSGPTIEGNRITGNEGCSGTGMFLASSPALVTDNVISENDQGGCAGGDGGGGIFVHTEGPAEIIGNVIINNVSAQGGGISLYDSGATVVAGNLIAGNEATSHGGGIILRFEDAAHVVNNLIYENHAGSTASQLRVSGVGLGSPEPLIANNTIAGETTSTLVHLGHNIEYFNNIAYGHGSGDVMDCDAAFVAGMGNNNFFHADGGSLFAPACGTPLAIAGNVSVDPSFVDATSGDYHLLFGSPMIDAGTATGAPTDDYDGDARPVDGDQTGGPAVDIGADEHIPPTQGIAGFVTDGNGDPAAGICVDVYQASVFVASTSTGSSGLYAIELPPANYKLHFDECVPGVLADEWYNDKASKAAGDLVAVVADTVTTGVDAQLAFDVLCNGLNPTIWGSSTPDVLVGTSGPDVIVGLGGKDVLLGLGGHDTLCGGNGNDVLSGGLGDDDLFGDADNDTVDYSDSATPVIVDLLFGVALGEGSDTLAGIENATGSDHDDELYGDGGVNVLRGRKGNDILDGDADDDVLFGGANDDLLHGGAGDDTLNGDNGIDIADYSDAPGPVNVDLSTGIATGASTDTLSDIRGVIGSAFDDTIVGDRFQNFLFGLAGDDVIKGGRNKDWIEGGDGEDDLDGEKADDIVFGGPNIDIIRGSRGNDQLIGGGARDRIFGGSGEDTIWGEGGRDIIQGGNDNDIILGGPQDDRILGQGGLDIITGDAGDDYIDGGADNDLVTYELAPGPVNASLVTDTGTGDGTDQFVGIEGIVGSLGNDTLTGDGAFNAIDGWEGDDTINGGGSGDNLFGWTGNDTINGQGGNDFIDGEADTDDLDGGADTDVCLNGETNSNCETVATTGLSPANTAPTLFTAGTGRRRLPARTPTRQPHLAVFDHLDRIALI